MSKAWDDYLPDVLLEATGCPTLIAVNAIRSAAVDLCGERSVWQEDLERSSLVAGDPLCDLYVPDDSEVATILDVRFYPVGETTALSIAGPTDEKTLNAVRPGWKDEACEGTVNTVSVCAYLSPLVLRVIPIPVVSQADAIAVTATLRPTRASTEGPDLLYTDYLETICTGALAKLLAMGNKPWSDLQTAVFKSAEFRRMKARAGIRVLTASGAMQMQVHPRTLA